MAESTDSAAELGTRLSALLECMQSAVLEAGADGSLISANAYARQIMPHLPAVPAAPGWVYRFNNRIKGFRNPDGTQMNPDEGPLSTCVRTGEAVNDWIFAIENLDGSLLHLLGSASPLFDESGTISGAICSYQDVSQIVHLREAVQNQLEQLRESHEALEKAHGAQSAFLGNISHELRTPLNAILGFADLLAVSEKLPPGSEEQIFVSEVIDAASDLAREIDNLLEYSKIVAGVVDIVPENQPTEAILIEATAAVERMCQRRNQSFEVDSTSAPNNLNTDWLRLIQVLQHLLDNASKFGRHGGMVKLEVVQEGEWVRFSVSDDGPGIPEEAEGRVYEPFRKAAPKTGELSTGVGLGLTLARSIVKMLEGEIDYETGPTGTRFDVRIPSFLRREELYLS